MSVVSIIMPVYNGMKTIQKALDSLYAQTFTDLEIVIVDDQSTDGTYEFLQSQAAQNPRIKLVRTPKNLGHGGAGRLALENVTGDWVTILDADDWCEPNRMEALLKAATELNADMVIDNLQIFDHAAGKIVKHTNYMGATPVQISPEDVFKRDNPLQRDSMGYCKPFMRTQFLRDHNINYWGKYRDNEDFTLLAEILLAGARTFVIPEAYYVYMHRISPTKRTVSAHSRSSDNSTLTVVKNCDELIEKHKSTMMPQARKELLRRKKIFQTAIVARQQNDFIQEGMYSKALGTFLTCPSLLIFRMKGIWNRVHTLLNLGL